MVGLDARFLSWVNTGRSSLVNIVRLSLVKSTPVSDTPHPTLSHAWERESAMLLAQGEGHHCYPNGGSPIRTPSLASLRGG